MLMMQQTSSPHLSAALKAARCICRWCIRRDLSGTCSVVPSQQVGASLCVHNDTCGTYWFETGALRTVAVIFPVSAASNSGKQHPPCFSSHNVAKGPRVCMCRLSSCLALLCPMVPCRPALSPTSFSLQSVWRPSSEAAKIQTGGQKWKREKGGDFLFKKWALKQNIKKNTPQVWYLLHETYSFDSKIDKCFHILQALGLQTTEEGRFYFLIIALSSFTKAVKSSAVAD